MIKVYGQGNDLSMRSEQVVLMKKPLCPLYVFCVSKTSHYLPTILCIYGVFKLKFNPFEQMLPMATLEWMHPLNYDSCSDENGRPRLHIMCS